MLASSTERGQLPSRLEQNPETLREQSEPRRTPSVFAYGIGRAAADTSRCSSLRVDAAVFRVSRVRVVLGMHARANCLSVESTPSLQVCAPVPLSWLELSPSLPQKEHTKKKSDQVQKKK